ncbi:MAG: branched-chain amino acid ABC transporter permease [Actinomycetota bacterium]
MEVLLLAALVAFPLVSQDLFVIDRVGRYLLYAVFALSVDLIWGYGGLFTFGHAFFFGAGGYLIGILTTREFLFLPVGLPVAVVLAVALVAAFAFAMSWFVFSGRGALRGVEFAVVTLAVAVVGQRVANAGGEVTGGQNGILMTESLGLGGLNLQSGRPFYALAAAILVLTYAGFRWFLASRTGLVLRGIRDNEDRVELLGYSVPGVKRRAFVLSAAVAALAGAIFFTRQGIVSPSAVGVSASTLVLLWVVLGGRGTLLGPVIGAILLPYLTAELSGTFLDTWLVVVGVILVAIIVLLPAGLFGFLDRGRKT